MDLSELTPELFETAEFTERRRGYDIDQVERFLEETGTAVAQLLVRHRQLEERLAQADARVAEADQQLQAAMAAAPQSQPARHGVSEAEEAAEIERATSTLLMAKRTADATIGEAEAEAARMRGEAATRVDQMIAEARQRAEDEYRTTRDRILQEVATLEARRDGLGSVVEGFEVRIGAYREQLGSIAGTLLAMTEDPEAFGVRPEVESPAFSSGLTTTAAAGRPVQGEDESEADTGHEDATQAHDTAAVAGEEGPWGQGSWSEVVDVSEAEATEVEVVEDDPPGSAGPTASADAGAPGDPEDVLDVEVVADARSDRYLQELDQAVNETGGREDAMTAFFEGSGEDQGRSRFGWRR